MYRETFQFLLHDVFARFTNVGDKSRQDEQHEGLREQTVLHKKKFKNVMT